MHKSENPAHFKRRIKEMACGAGDKLLASAAQLRSMVFNDWPWNPL